MSARVVRPKIGATLHLTLGRRLRAGRLVAGIATSKQVGDALKIAFSTWRGFESGRRKASAMALLLFNELTGVSIEYLNDGVPTNEMDFRAAVIEEVLDRAETTAWKCDQGVVRRLHDMRIRAGYRSAAAAATANGWRVSTYVIHEGGRPGPPLEVLIRYARSLNTTAEYLAFGTGPRHPQADDIETRAKDTEDATAARPTDGPADLMSAIETTPAQPWPWLPTASYADRHLIQLPLLAYSSGRLRLEESSIVMPAKLLSIDLTRRFFGLVGTARSTGSGSTEIRIIESKGNPEPGRIIVDDGKSLRPVDGQTSGLEFRDPVGQPGTGPRPVVVGKEIGRITIEVF